MKPSERIIEVELEPQPAAATRVYVCSDKHIHLMMEDVEGNVLGELVCQPEDALTIARRITEAADRAMGI